MIIILSMYCAKYKVILIFIFDVLCRKRGLQGDQAHPQEVLASAKLSLRKKMMKRWMKEEKRRKLKRKKN